MSKLDEHRAWGWFAITCTKHNKSPWVVQCKVQLLNKSFIFLTNFEIKSHWGTSFEQKREIS